MEGGWAGRARQLGVGVGHLEEGALARGLSVFLAPRLEE